MDANGCTIVTDEENQRVIAKAIDRQILSYTSNTVVNGGHHSQCILSPGLRNAIMSVQVLAGGFHWYVWRKIGEIKKKRFLFVAFYKRQAGIGRNIQPIVGVFAIV